MFESAAIHGETGTGKELVAQAIHDESFRKCGSYFKLNCGNMTASSNRLTICRILSSKGDGDHNDATACSARRYQTDQAGSGR
jgi:transcriptional regulator of acetoin/glycerol metabolism